MGDFNFLPKEIRQEIFLQSGIDALFILRLTCNEIKNQIDEIYLTETNCYKYGMFLDTFPRKRLEEYRNIGTEDWNKMYQSFISRNQTTNLLIYRGLIFDLNPDTRVLIVYSLSSKEILCTSYINSIVNLNPNYLRKRTSNSGEQWIQIGNSLTNFKLLLKVVSGKNAHPFGSISEQMKISMLIKEFENEITVLEKNITILKPKREGDTYLVIIKNDKWQVFETSNRKISFRSISRDCQVIEIGKFVYCKLENIFVLARFIVLEITTNGYGAKSFYFFDPLVDIKLHFLCCNETRYIQRQKLASNVLSIDEFLVFYNPKTNKLEIK